MYLLAYRTLLLMVSAACVCLSAQTPTRKQYDGQRFQFRYPRDFELQELAPTDVVIGSGERQIKLEIALALATPKSNEQMVLNAEKHLSDFAHQSKMQVTFEGWKELEGGGVIVISHLRSDALSVDVVSTMRAIAGQVLLIEVMFPPGSMNDATELAGSIVETLRLKS